MKAATSDRNLKNQVTVESIAHSTPLISGRVLWLMAALLWLAVLLTVLGGEARAQEQEDTLMLVREWNSKAGKLIGWLPTHQVTMILQLEDNLGKTEFDCTEAVTISWMKSHGTPDPVAVSPQAREFDGQKWLPITRDANLVRVKKRLFLIRSIAFGNPPHNIKDALKAAPGQESPSPRSFAASAPPR